MSESTIKESVEMKLTKLEQRVISAFMLDDYVCDDGWDSPEACTWIDGFCDDSGISASEFPGVMSSLVKKGMIKTNGEMFSLTVRGINYIKQGINK